MQTPRPIASGAVFGLCFFLLLLDAELGLCAFFLPSDVLASAVADLRVDVLLFYVATGLVLGAALGAALPWLRAAEEARAARAILPHLLAVGVVGLALALGDRDLPGASIVGGVATVMSGLALLPRRLWLRSVALCTAVITLGVFTLLRPPEGEWSEAASSELPRAAPEAPDLILVVLDTLRRDQLSTWADLDGGTVPTPQLDRIAAAGVRFDSAWAASPWSVPSHASLFSGKLPARHGASSDSLQLDEGVPLLAEQLGRAGYLTAAFSANPWVAPPTGLTRGFALFHGEGHSVMLESRFILYRILGGRLLGGGDMGGRALVDQAGELLDRRPVDRPLFLFVNLTEAHAPYSRLPRAVRRSGGADDREARLASLRVLEAQHHAVPLDPSVRKPALRAYGAAVQYVDSLLGELVDAIDAAPGKREAVLVVVADHGESFGEHGIWGHNRGLYRPLIQVPALLRAPGRAPAGARVEEPVSLVDIAPTLLDAASLDPAALQPDGLALIPLLGRPDDPAWQRTLRAEHGPPTFHVKGLRAQGRVREADAIDRSLRTIIAPPWRYELDSLGGEALYHLDSDPDELLDRSQDPQNETLVARLRAELQATPPPPRTNRSTPPPDLPPETEAQLRSLGYLD